MDRSAIEAIQAGHVADVANTAIASLVNDAPVALPDNFALHDLERYRAGRNRFRGTFKTHLIDEFASNREIIEGAAVFVDPDTMSATAIYNLGDDQNPGHCDDKAVVTLKPTPAYIALCDLVKAYREQKAVAEFLEDWRDHVTAYDANGDELDLKKAIAGIRNIKVKATSEREHEDGDFNASRSALDAIDARGNKNLPAGLLFSCTPHHGLDQRDFSVRLSLITNEPPLISLRITKREHVAEEIAREFTDKLREALGGAPGDAIHIGTFAP